MSELPENARKWVEALRSGEFEQAREELRDDRGGFCCLGVACELYRREVGGDWIELEDDQDTFSHLFAASLRLDDRNKTGLPPSVRRWLRIGSATGDYSSSNSSLASDNDNGVSFAEIADIIEARWDDLKEREA